MLHLSNFFVLFIYVAKIGWQNVVLTDSVRKLEQEHSFVGNLSSSEASKIPSF